MRKNSKKKVYETLNELCQSDIIAKNNRIQNFGSLRNGVDK